MKSFIVGATKREIKIDGLNFNRVLNIRGENYQKELNHFFLQITKETNQLEKKHDDPRDRGKSIIQNGRYFYIHVTTYYAQIQAHGDFFFDHGFQSLSILRYLIFKLNSKLTYSSLAEIQSPKFKRFEVSRCDVAIDIFGIKAENFKELLDVDEFGNARYFRNFGAKFRHHFNGDDSRKLIYTGWSKHSGSSDIVVYRKDLEVSKDLKEIDPKFNKPINKEIQVINGKSQEVLILNNNYDPKIAYYGNEPTVRVECRTKNIKESMIANFMFYDVTNYPDQESFCKQFLSSFYRLHKFLIPDKKDPDKKLSRLKEVYGWKELFDFKNVDSKTFRDLTGLCKSYIIHNEYRVKAMSYQNEKRDEKALTQLAKSKILAEKTQNNYYYQNLERQNVTAKKKAIESLKLADRKKIETEKFKAIVAELDNKFEFELLVPKSGWISDPDPFDFDEAPPEDDPDF